MKKKVKIIELTAVIAIILVVGICLAVNKLSSVPGNYLDEVGAVNEAEKHKVTVSINTESQTSAVYEEIIDEETGETVVAEVQENAPPETKPTEPPKKPKSNESYTNPEAPPQYSEEQVKVTEKSKSQTIPDRKKNDVGKVYVEGFGYVETGASTQSKTGQSSGDINKMVGTMD